MEKFVDHKGMEFETLEAMLEHWGVTRQAYMVRKHNGWSLERILTTVSDWQKSHDTGADAVKKLAKVGCFYVDHNGRKFGTMKEMCQHYGISTQCFQDRARRGESLRDCLRPRSKGQVTPWNAPADDNIVSDMDSSCVYDHEGMSFMTEGLMCQHWGISEEVYFARRAKGCSLKEALTGDTVMYPCFDHTGKRYVSESQMLQYYGISAETYYMRRLTGWSMKDALTAGNEKE